MAATIAPSSLEPIQKSSPAAQPLAAPITKPAPAPIANPRPTLIFLLNFNFSISEIKNQSGQAVNTRP